MAERHRRWTGPEIVVVLRHHLVERVVVSKVREETGCRLSQIYRWQQALFEGEAAVFERKDGSPAAPFRRMFLWTRLELLRLTFWWVLRFQW